MTPTRAEFQCRRDRDLRVRLSEDRGVKGALARFKELTGGWGFSSRRSLLTRSLRLTRAMSPGVADAVLRCKELLRYEGDVEVFVRPEPVFNAFCVTNPAGPLVIGLSSRIIEAFEPDELTFVVGHELGHAAFDHGGFPMPALAKVEDYAGTIVSHATALELYVWCRAAEISADRAGLVCCANPEAAASAFFKLTSGLARGFVQPDLDAFAAQVESLASAPAARERPRDEDDTLDCFSTHPYSPLRVRALVAYARSAQWKGDGGLSMEQVEAAVEHDLDLMEPSYLEERTSQSELLRRALYAGGVLVAIAGGQRDDRKEHALRLLLGAQAVDRRLDEEAARAELAKVLPQIAELPVVRRAQLVQHLTVVATADGVLSDAELAEIERVADAAGVDRLVITHTLEGAARPMD